MKRLQLFELEDQSWFPGYLRVSMTRMLTMLHGWLRTPHRIATILAEVIGKTGIKEIVDLCSGDGGAMLAAHGELHQMAGMENVTLMLTDLFPNPSARMRIESNADPLISYGNEPVDATTYRGSGRRTIRTLVAGFHHMPPERARAILQQAQQCRDPIVIYEISDNSLPPAYLWWIGLPLNLLFGFFVAAMVRPMSWKHFVFSFVVPLIPLAFAWDGAVSNARTYTPADLDELLADCRCDDYEWTVRVIKARPANHLCLVGMPRTH